MATYDELRSAADAIWAAVEKPQRPLFIVSMNTSSVAAGARETFDALRKLADAGGCIGVIVARKYLGSSSIESVVDHLLHVIDVAGEDVPALGSDFDGFVVPPEGLEDVASLPNLTAALARRGVGEALLRKILGANAQRVLADVEPTAYRAARAPS